jgi:hypothetical protein
LPGRCDECQGRAFPSGRVQPVNAGCVAMPVVWGKAGAMSRSPGRRLSVCG